MSKHTPGPWKALEGNGTRITTSAMVETMDGLFVAGCPEEDANLIASAPDLMEALEAVLIFHSDSFWSDDKHKRWKEITGKDEATTKILCDKVRQAIAKAEGKV